MSKPLILIDGSSYLFRAFHALPPLTNSHGEPTNAMLGVMNMLRRLIKDYQPDHAVMIFDAKGKTFRHTLFPEYKAHRDAMPEALAVQIAPLKEMIELLGFPLVCIPGVEADDIIGTLTRQAVAHGQEVLIATGDKDIAQLIQEHVHIVDTMKDARIDRDYVIKKFGVTPEQIIDFLALVGDTADNIPGIPKVGPKTAAKWLNEYGDINNLKQHAHEITGKVGEYLRDNLDQLNLAIELTTIKCDVDLNISLDQMKMKSIDIDNLRSKLEHYEFKNWLRELNPAKENDVSSNQTNVNPKDMKYDCIVTRSAWQTWQKKLKNAEIIAVDTGNHRT